MATLHSLEQRFIAQRTELAMKAGQKAQLDLQYTQAVAERQAAQAKLELYEKTAELLLRASGQAREAVKTKIEHLVSLALTAVTQAPYAFRMEMVQSAGQWSVQFVIVSPEGTEVDPLDGAGGGIADICSMALRIAVLQLYEPTIEGPLCLDESGKFLSRDLAQWFVEFLRTIHQQTGRQILLVTHVPELAAGADRTFEVRPTGATSEVIILNPEEPHA